MIASINNPLILIFDLDETLYCCEENNCPDRANSLSKSAAKTLSLKSSKGYIQNPTDRITKLRAIDRNSFESIFRKINQVLINNKTLESPRISVKILTSSTYDVSFVKMIFNKLYAEKDEELYSILNIEFFNRQSMDELKTNNSIPAQKEDLIDLMYTDVWKKQWPNLERKRIYLIDNDNENIKGVNGLGFNALLWPTTPKSRNDESFTINRDEVIKEINRLIDELAT